MKGLNGKKGLILIALMIAAMLGAYASQYYTWTVSYTISPLLSTPTATIPLGDHSGASKFTYTKSFTDELKPVKAVDAYFLVPEGYGAPGLGDLGANWYTLDVTVKIDLDDDGTYTAEECKTMALVTGGIAFTPTGEGISGLSGIWVTFSVPPGVPALDMEIAVDGWTGAIDTGTGPASFTIFIYAVE